MSAVLTGPFLTAAGVVCVSGITKLRAPEPAARALGSLGVRVSESALRVLSTAELLVGIAAALAPGRAVAAALACMYGTFAGLALALAHRQTTCGCFGDTGTPATTAQAGLSLVLAAVCALGAVWVPAGGLGWVLAQPPATAATLLVGFAGCVYATVLAYVRLPAAWAAWGGR